MRRLQAIFTTNTLQPGDSAFLSLPSSAPVFVLSALIGCSVSPHVSSPFQIEIQETVSRQGCNFRFGFGPFESLEISTNAFKCMCDPSLASLGRIGEDNAANVEKCAMKKDGVRIG